MLYNANFVSVNWILGKFDLKKFFFAWQMLHTLLSEYFFAYMEFWLK